MRLCVTMQGTCSEQDYNTEHLALPQEGTEDGESVHSTTDMSDGASVQDNAEYVNPRGVRFMPHHLQNKDGTYSYNFEIFLLKSIVINIFSKVVHLTDIFYVCVALYLLLYFYGLIHE